MREPRKDMNKRKQQGEKGCGSDDGAINYCTLSDYSASPSHCSVDTISSMVVWDTNQLYLL
jgi:hypothetical protein